MSKQPRPKIEGKNLYVVRLYDGFDYIWIDVSEPMSYEKAKAILNNKTNNGTEKTCYNHIDYYDIFPVDTKMLYS